MKKGIHPKYPPLDIDKLGEEMRARDCNKIPVVAHNDQRYLREYRVDGDPEWVERAVRHQRCQAVLQTKLSTDAYVMC